jgi:polyprenyl P-hydroxybenzoate/phenylacrylic acid decarboxylase-like protein
MSEPAGNIVVAITGASGAAYARRLVQLLAATDPPLHVHLVLSPHGRRLLADELGIRRASPDSLVGGPVDRCTAYDYEDVGAAPASGSFPTKGMIVCPCSSNTLGAIASGLADNLIARAAHVTLKERRRLVLVHREMPLSEIDLRNMLRVTRAGGIICPAAPAFYMMPRTIDDLVDFVVGRVLDLFELPHALNTRWASRQAPLRLPRGRVAGR